MKGHAHLSPWGTARIGLLAAKGETSKLDALDGLVQHLRETVQVYNVEEPLIHLAREIVRWQPDLDVEEQRAMLLLVLISLINLHEGSTRLPVTSTEGRAYLGEILANLLAGLRPDTLPAGWNATHALALMERILDTQRARTILGHADEFKPLLFDPPYLYHQRLRVLEDRFVAILGRHLQRRPAEMDDRLVRRQLDDVFRKPAMRNGRTIALTPEQQRAVETAVRSPLAVISGGPGTGKTTIVVSILRVLRRLGVTLEEIALAAPTGKAANRMGESIKQGLEGLAHPDPADADLLRVPAPRTLHRLLGYSPGTDRFQHHENNRLSEKVVIVDEGSMIDLFLMERLVRSLRDDARFILLGDAEQLPSVEAGAVLRDLLLERPRGQEPLLGDGAVRLTQSYRMDPSDPAGSNILRVAQRINSGAADLLLLPSDDRGAASMTVRAAVADVAFDRTELLATDAQPGVVEEFVKRWYDRFLSGWAEYERLACKVYHHGRDGFRADDTRDLLRLFQHFDRFRLLCLTHVFATGAHRINALLHARLLEDAGVNYAAEYHAGEPVMMQINDYDKMIFNGDQGLVLRVAEERGRPQLMAVFPRAEGYGVFPPEMLRGQIKLSFAMTVHKSQGSEFEHVALILPEEDLPLNSRELLYTAMTRSKKSVTVLGSRAVLASGVHRKIQRFSGIAEKLGQVLAREQSAPGS